MRHLYIIAGANGSGKTTFAQRFLPLYAHCPEFINADLLAKGLAPFSPESAAIHAGKLFLAQIEVLAVSGKNFAFETTLSGKAYAQLLRKLRLKGYQIHLIFLRLPSVELALERVRQRMFMGGHAIPEDTVRRRYASGYQNLINLYAGLADSLVVFDNSHEVPVLIYRRTLPADLHAEREALRCL